MIKKYPVMHIVEISGFFGTQILREIIFREFCQARTLRPLSTFGSVLKTRKY